MMLDFIRNSAQSMGVKVAFGLIILVFVFWGVGNMQSMNAASVVASVNGEYITAIDFERTYRQAYESVKAQNPQMTPTQINQMQLPQQVLETLVISNLLKQEAQRLDLSVSALELRSIIDKIPAFHNAEGKFDPEIYTRLATSQFPTVGAFEQNIRNSVLEEKLRKDVTVTATSLPSEARAFYDYTFEKRNIDYIFFDADAAKDSIKAPTEDSLKATYESERSVYTLPAKSDVSYVRVSALDLGKPQDITEAAIKAYYDTNIADFSTAARAKVRHILLNLTADSPEADVQKAEATMAEIVKQLESGADFAELAIKYSQDAGTAPNGGDLDWLSEGETVQAFNDTVFAMASGETSKPVRSEFGLHLIKVDTMEKATVQPLTQVTEEIRTKLAEEAGLAKIREVVDTLIEANILGNDLATAAKNAGLSLKNTGLNTAAELEKLLKISSAAATEIMDMNADVPLDTSLQTTDNAYIIARIKEKIPAKVRPFEEVKADISAKLMHKAALEAALTKASETRKNMQDTTPADLQVKSITDVQRGSEVGFLGMQQELSAALFNSPKGAWLPSAYTVSIDGKEGAVLVRVSEVTAPDDAQWQTMEQIINSIITSQRQDKMFKLFLSALSTKAEVEILNEAYLNAFSQ